MRLIDADALINDILTDYGCDPKYIADETIDGLKPYTDQLILERIGLQPTVPAAPRWVRCEDAKPKDKQECFVAYKGPLGFIYDSAMFYDDLNNGLGEDIFEDGTSGFVMYCDVGYALTSMDYWMPIEPPREGV